MNRRAAAAPFALALALCACDPKAETQASSGAAPELAAPEPSRLYRPNRMPTRPPTETPTAARLAEAAAAPQPQASEGLTVSGARLFDGAGLMPVSYSPASRPAFSRRAIVRRAGMTIDTDGRIADPALYRRVAAGDRWRSSRTSLRYSNGRSLDPTRVPFIVLPLGFQGARLGDLAYVEYNGRGAWAIVGDYGPADRFGEGSSALAAQLGIDPSGATGGVRRGVTYTIFPGTARPYATEDQLTGRVRTAGAELAPSGAIEV